MTRLARDRDTHLTRSEIATETLRCFDQSATAPSIRDLAVVLRVTPAAIYHHFPGRPAIIQATVDLVWEEAATRFLQLLPDPLTADPTDVLVSAGIATRRAFAAHYQVAPFIAATTEASGPLARILAHMAGVLARMGLEGDEAAASFHTYASFTIGSVVFAATRRITNEQLKGSGAATPSRNLAPQDAYPPWSAGINSVVRHALEETVDLSAVDPDRDEALFAAGLRRLVTGF